MSAVRGSEATQQLDEEYKMFSHPDEEDPEAGYLPLFGFSDIECQ